MAPDKLQEILREALRKKQADTGLRLTSLLQGGTQHQYALHKRLASVSITLLVCAMVQQEMCVSWSKIAMLAHMAIKGAAKVQCVHCAGCQSDSVHGQQLTLPHWLRAAHSSAALPPKLALRQAGEHRPSSKGDQHRIRSAVHSMGYPSYSPPLSPIYNPDASRPADANGRSCIARMAQTACLNGHGLGHELDIALSRLVPFSEGRQATTVTATACGTAAPPAHPPRAPLCSVLHHL